MIKPYTSLTRNNYTDIQDVFNNITNDINERGETCNMASGLYDKMCKLETCRACMASLLAFDMQFLRDSIVRAAR